MKFIDVPRFFVSSLGTGGPVPTHWQLVPEARHAAATFVHDRLLDPYVTGRIRQAFASNGSIFHVFLEHALRAEITDAIAKELQKTSFVPHHHAPYPLHIAPLPSIYAQGPLGRFVSWLRSPIAAAYHTALVGVPSLPRSVSSAWVQVQVARMTTGEHFPLHIDTDEEGITCVYQFTQGYEDADGGRLFLGASEALADIVVPPVMGSLFVFRPKDAPHGVTVVNAPAHRPRFTVSAFYLYGKHRSDIRRSAPHS